MVHKRRLAAALLVSAFFATAAVSSAVGYGVGLGSNMANLYPSFSHLEPRPYAPYAANDKSARERYKREVEDYTDAAQQYLLNAQNDINLIVREAEQAQIEANRAIDEYNSFVSRTN